MHDELMGLWGQLDRGKELDGYPLIFPDISFSCGCSVGGWRGGGGTVVATTAETVRNLHCRLSFHQGR